jgi:hypothetical protein
LQIVATDTTLMPNRPLLPFLIALLFGAAAEFRCNASQTRIVGTEPPG